MPSELEIWRDLPYFIAGVLGLIVLFKTLAATVIKFAEIWQSVSQKRNEVDTKRNEIEDRSLNMLMKVSELLERLTERHSDTQKMLSDYEKTWGAHDKQQSEIRQSLLEVQTTLDKLIEHSKQCPQITDQIKLGFEELSEAIRDIKQLVNGYHISTNEVENKENDNG